MTTAQTFTMYSGLGALTFTCLALLGRRPALRIAAVAFGFYFIAFAIAALLGGCRPAYATEVTLSPVSKLCTLQHELEEQISLLSGTTFLLPDEEPQRAALLRLLFDTETKTGALVTITRLGEALECYRPLTKQESRKLARKLFDAVFGTLR